MSLPELQRPELAQRLRWRLRRMAAQTAWPEFLALAAILFWIGVAVVVNRPLQRDMRQLQVHGAALPERPGAPTEASVPMVPGSSALTDAFMAFLPPLDQREQQLQTLHVLARDSGVELSRVDYGHTSLEHLPGRRLSMQMTVGAEYAPYRKFLHLLLIAMPNLAIDRVTMESAPGQPGRLNVRLEASLYYRNVESGVAR